MSLYDDLTDILTPYADKINQNTASLNDLQDDLDNLGLSDDVKTALLDCFSHIAWTDEHGQDYVDALENALYPETGLV